MNKTQIEIIVDTLLPDLYGFAFAMAKDEQQAEELVIDAYTVYILREKEYLKDHDVDFSDQRERVSTKRFIHNELIREIYELSRRKAKLYQQNYDHHLEFYNFYELNIQRRAILYLKEVSKLTIEDIQEVFALQRHQVLELLHNSYHNLVRDIQTQESVQ